MAPLLSVGSLRLPSSVGVPQLPEFGDTGCRVFKDAGDIHLPKQCSYSNGVFLKSPFTQNLRLSSDINQQFTSSGSTFHVKLTLTHAFSSERVLFVDGYFQAFVEERPVLLCVVVRFGGGGHVVVHTVIRTIPASEALG